MQEIDISKFLTNKNRQNRTGTCISCNKVVQWAKDRLASHKRMSCPNTTPEEKRIFAKRNILSLEVQSFQQTSTSPLIPNSSVDRLTNDRESKTEIDMKLATFFYRTGISFRLVESNAFQDFVKSLNSSYASSIPSAKSLSGSLLDQKYTNCLASMNEILSTHQNLTLMSDGWTNVRGDHIVNFCVKAPNEKPFFYTSIDTSGIVQNASSIANAISDVIEALGPEKLCSFVSDNAPVMRSAWKIIEEIYPHISVYGCAAHAINLLIKDITSAPEALTTINEAIMVIKFIKNHHIVKALYEEKRLAACVSQTLSLPVVTRWYSCYNAMNNLQDSKYVLMMLVDEAEEILKKIQPQSTSAEALKLIKSQSFWDSLSKLVKKIKFPSHVIGKLESDSASLSFVYDYFGQLYNAFEDDSEIQQKIKLRLKFIMTKTTGLAFILTPKHAAQGFYFDDDKIEFIAYAADFANNVQPDIADKVCEEMIDFVGEMTSLPDRMREVTLKMSAKQYWNIIGQQKYPTVYQIAKPIINMICSSATCERVWSTFKFIHSRVRNRLSNERVKKLVFLYTNIVLMDGSDNTDYIMDECSVHSELECEEFEA